MSWVLTKQLQAFRDQMDAAFPHRDRRSDGTIGDAAHQAEKSGHNPDKTANAEYKDGDSKDEVRAIDIDSDTGNPDVSMEDIVQHLVRLARAGKLSFIRYLIFNRRIWAASAGWAQQAYSGPSPHTEHLHMSGAYTQAADEDADADYHLEDLVAPTKADFIAWLKDDEVREALCRAVAYTDRVLPAPAGSTNADGTANEFWTVWGFLLNNYNAAVSARTYSAQARDKDAVDEQALAAALAAALPAGVQVTQQQLQAAIVGALRELAAA